MVCSRSSAAPSSFADLALTRTSPRRPISSTSPPGEMDRATVEDSARTPVSALRLRTAPRFGQPVIA